MLATSDLGYYSSVLAVCQVELQISQMTQSEKIKPESGT